MIPRGEHLLVPVEQAGDDRPLLRRHVRDVVPQLVPLPADVDNMHDPRLHGEELQRGRNETRDRQEPEQHTLNNERVPSFAGESTKIKNLPKVIRPGSTPSEPVPMIE